MRWFFTVSAALMLASLPSIVSGQGLSVRDNINNMSFTHAPSATKSVADAIIRFQLKEDPRKLDEIDVFEKGFQALPMQFGPPNERDYVVMGNGFPFTGGDNNWFWIVRMLPGGPKVVLWLHCLNFGFDKSRTHGFLNIFSEWNSPSEELDEGFRFNGSRYVRVTHRYGPFVGER